MNWHLKNPRPYAIKNNMLTLGVGVSENAYYTYDTIKSLEDRITVLENK